LFSAFLLQNSYAITCSDGTTTPVETHGCIGVGKIATCGVCKAANTTWDSPKIEVVYDQVGELPQGETVLADGECGGIFGIRFCVRKAEAGSNGNSSDGVKFRSFSVVA
jgi:hypothetical protein